MENRRGTMIKVVMACLMVVAVMKGATAADYVVGDSGWTLPPNTSFYSDWAASKTFQIGDSVLFNWTGNHTMADLASKEEYDSCRDPGTVFDSGFKAILTSNGSRFFICTVGNHCEQGQKVTITVGSPTNTAAWSCASSLTTTSLGLGLISTLVLSLITM